MSLAWVGRSLAGWQFRQRGCVSTLAASAKIARERSPGSEMEENADGGWRVERSVCAKPYAVCMRTNASPTLLILEDAATPARAAAATLAVSETPLYRGISRVPSDREALETRLAGGDGRTGFQIAAQTPPGLRLPGSSEDFVERNVGCRQSGQRVERNIPLKRSGGFTVACCAVLCSWPTDGVAVLVPKFFLARSKINWRPSQKGRRPAHQQARARRNPIPIRALHKYEGETASQ
jgi:hypothetical protein